LSSSALHPLSPFFLPHCSPIYIYSPIPWQLHRSGSVAGRRRISSKRLFCLSKYISERSNVTTAGRTWRRGLQVRQDMHRYHLSLFNFLPTTWT
jgi:hypothetical protein